MGLLERMRGSREPAAGVAPAAAEDLRAALLAVGGADAPWTIDEDEDGRLRAEWDLGGAGTEHAPRRVFRVLMRLDAEAHAVDAIDELSSAGGGRSIKRGNITLGGFRKTYMRGPEGYELAAEEHTRTPALKDGLRAATTERGWRWNGRLLRTP